MFVNMIINKKKLIEDKKKIIDKIIHDNKIIYNYKKLHKPFPLKNEYNTINPPHLYTCWHTRELPPIMKQNYDYLVSVNPEISFHLYDENDCRQFIQDNFEEEILDTYNKLIPCSYKSDLWRFCILYIHGGIYMDIKFRCVNGFKIISLTEKEYFVRDRPDNCVYTALIVTLPKNEIMLKCINKIVENVKNNYYGENPLYPTGPALLGSFFDKNQIKILDLNFKNTYIENIIDKYYIVYYDRIILTYYNEYREEQSKYQKNKHYSQLWEEKNIYKNMYNLKYINKNNVEIIIARYNENLNWLNEYPFNQFEYIVYNKGINNNFSKTNVKNVVNLENVGRCDHTYLYHIIENYNNLSNILVFFPGSLAGDKKDKAIQILNYIIKSDFSKAFFLGSYYESIKNTFGDFTLDEWSASYSENFSLNNEKILEKSRIRPYNKWYTYFFRNTPAQWCTMWGVFSIDKQDIIQHPILRYQQLLQTVNSHSNPEAGHYIERSWGAIFYPLMHTIKIKY